MVGATIKSLITEFKQGSSFFQRFINTKEDYNYTLNELAELHKVKPELLIYILEYFETEKLPVKPLDFKILDVLTYIQITHDYYRQNRLQSLETIIQELKTIHKEKDTLNETLDSYFSFLKEDLLHHMLKEEQILFPYIKQLLIDYDRKDKSNAAIFETKLLECFIEEHDNEMEMPFFKTFSYIPYDFLTYENTGHLMMLEKNVQQFKKDLRIHSWVEEQLLIPMAIKRRNELYS